MNFAWEPLGEGVTRCRLPFLDVTVGLVRGRTGTLLIDADTTLTEAHATDQDVRRLTRRPVTHIVLTHNHFDHILGSSAFADAAVYCAPEVAATIADDTGHLRADAMRHGANSDEVDRAIAALRTPEYQVRGAVVDLGDRTVSITHPGRGHSNHDLIVIVGDRTRTVVFCGDLVEEPIVTVQPSLPLTRVRSCVSAQLIGIAGWKWLSGSSGTFSLSPEIPTYSSTSS